MALEPTFNYIDDLNESNPIGNIDTLDEADNHLRGIKEAVKGSFPNLGQAAVTLTASAINGIPADVTANALGIIPVGGIIMYNGAFSAIPSNYQLCDGSNGTPNMAGKFIYGTNTEGQVEDTGGTANAIVVSHSHTRGTMNITGGVTNIVRNQSAAAVGSGAFNVSGKTVDSDGGESRQGFDMSFNAASSWSGNTSTAGSSGTNANIPPYLKLAYIRRMS